MTSNTKPTLQKEDIIYFLPIRWAAHCYWNNPPWELSKWKNYILSWDNPFPFWEFFIHFINNRGGKFRTRTLEFLRQEKALTPLGFWLFYHRCFRALCNR